LRTHRPDFPVRALETPMSRFELAQLNIAKMKGPLDSPLLADFVANLDRINALAESSPGFVWRLQTDQGNATNLRPLGDMTLVNLSVWRDVESLQTFVYKSAHAQIMTRRKEWFERMANAKCKVMGRKVLIDPEATKWTAYWR